MFDSAFTAIKVKFRALHQATALKSSREWLAALWSVVVKPRKNCGAHVTSVAAPAPAVDPQVAYASEWNSDQPATYLSPSAILQQQENIKFEMDREEYRKNWLASSYEISC